MGNQSRSKSLPSSSSKSPNCIPSGEAPDDAPRTSKVASKRLTGSSTQTPFRKLGRPLWEGERQILTVLASECVSAILLSCIEADKKEELAKTTPPCITRKGEGGNGNL